MIRTKRCSEGLKTMNIHRFRRLSLIFKEIQRYGLNKFLLAYNFCIRKKIAKFNIRDSRPDWVKVERLSYWLFMNVSSLKMFEAT